MGTDEELQRRKGLTFAQAEGLAPLPRQLARAEISTELRAVLWRYIVESLEGNSEDGYLLDPWRELVAVLHVYHLHKLDDPPDRVFEAAQQIRPIFEKGSYSDIYG